MFLYWGADAARANVERYERHIDRLNLSSVIQSIDVASQQGYTAIKWRNGLSENNITELRAKGYQVNRIGYNVYEICW